MALPDIVPTGAAAIPTGVPEFDRVLGAGLTPGAIAVLGGEPGIGKSTLVLQALARMAQSGRRCLLVSAEESPAQVRRRAERMHAVAPGLWLISESEMSGIVGAAGDLRPDVLVVDSIQSVWDDELESAPGSVAQVRGCAHRLAELARREGPSTILIGHVTKDGTLAGPRTLEHLVDTVLSFEGDRHHALRLLRAVKHRFGPTGELGLFEMTPTGLAGVSDAGGLFLADRRRQTPGSVVFAAMEGQRPLVVEIQALVVQSTMANPRWSATGFDGGRLALLLAVLRQRAGLDLSRQDVYVSVVGGVRVSDPGADLAVCMALASAFTGAPAGDDLVVLGEVGLGGETRQVRHTPRRLSEAARLGFARALIPERGPDDGPLMIQRAPTVAHALDACLGSAALVAAPLRVVGGDP